MLSYEEMKLISKMAWIGIKNGNRVDAEALDPTRSEYKLLCSIANEIDKQIKAMEDAE